MPKAKELTGLESAASGRRDLVIFHLQILYTRWEGFSRRLPPEDSSTIRFSILGEKTFYFYYTRWEGISRRLPPENSSTIRFSILGEKTFYFLFSFRLVTPCQLWGHSDSETPENLAGSRVPNSVILYSVLHSIFPTPPSRPKWSPLLCHAVFKAANTLLLP